MSDAQRSWLQRNAFLAAAAALPLIIVVLFLAATAIPASLVADPRYDVLLALGDQAIGPNEIGLEFAVLDGRVTATATRGSGRRYPTHQSLQRFDVSTGALEEIAVAIPDPVREKLQNAVISAGEDPPSARFSVPGLSGLELNPQRVAPDGYQFFQDHSGRHGLFGELFGIGGSRYRLGVSKSGRRVLADPGENRYRYADATFLAWLEVES